LFSQLLAGLDLIPFAQDVVEFWRRKSAIGRMPPDQLLLMASIASVNRKCPDSFAICEKNTNCSADAQIVGEALPNRGVDPRTVHNLIGFFQERYG